MEKKMEDDQGRTRAIADEMMRSVGIGSESRTGDQRSPAKLPTTDRTVDRRTTEGQSRGYVQKGLKSQGRRTKVVDNGRSGAPEIPMSTLRQKYPLLRESVAMDLDFDFIARKLHFALIDALEAHDLIVCGGEEALALRDRSCPIMGEAIAKIVDSIVANDWMRKTK